MKKFLLLTLMLICFSGASFAQIQRDFWGLTIGVSSKSSVINYLSTNNIDYMIVNDHHYMAKNMNFADVEWQYVHFDFSRYGTLCAIDFSVSGTPTLMGKIRTTLQRSLIKKYSIYHNYDFSTSDRDVFMDDHLTAATLSYDYSNSQDKRNVSLLFSDLGLCQ